MIVKNKKTGLWDVTCDECSTEFDEIEADDFRDVVKILKKKHWDLLKIEDEWEHLCPMCSIPF